MCQIISCCTQDRAAGTMQFTLAKPGMLKHFEGQWTVTAVEGKMHTRLACMHLCRAPCPGSGSLSLPEAAHCKGPASPCQQCLALQQLLITSASIFPSLGRNHACLMMCR